MKGEQAVEEHDHEAQTCDMWGHVIKEPLPNKADGGSKTEISDSDRLSYAKRNAITCNQAVRIDGIRATAARNRSSS
jgi:hypothetical protein